MACRESELVGNVPREMKETIAACISQLNQCPYCVDAHTILLTAKGDNKTAQQITKKQYQNIENPKTRKMAAWALSTLSPNSDLIANPPFEDQEAPEVIGTAVFYHYINPLVTIFLGETPLPIPILRAPMKKIASRLFKKAVSRPTKSGTSLFLLSERNLPKDLSWAKNSTSIAGAYGRLAAVITNIEKTYVPVATRKTITQHVEKWSPEPHQKKTEWVDEAAEKADSLTEIATNLAYLTINQPYRMKKEIIDSFQKQCPHKNQLLAITAWASFMKAKKIGTWLNNK